MNISQLGDKMYEGSVDGVRAVRNSNNFGKR
jgi:hypothetical protein